MLIVGDKDIENNAVAVRSRSEGDLGSKSIDEFIKDLSEEIRTKAIK